MNSPNDLIKYDNGASSLPVPEIFADFVKEIHAATAVVPGVKTVVYKALNEKANLPLKLVVYSKNVAIDIIGTTRSIEMVSKLKAILKINKACHPFNLPSLRHLIRQIIDDSGPWCLSTVSNNIVSIPGGKRCNTHNKFFSFPPGQYLINIQTNYNAHLN
ncbi:MAG: hypothetical protein H7Y86_22340 [Rhizobacter sp.]|nr:hypothetical protein [Ferruginibacter sp.]